jgi:hypothetical protein
MSYIFPILAQRHYELKAELIELGGKDKETFRFGIAWDGEHYFELTENQAGHDLYDAWLISHGGTPSPWDDSTDPADTTVDDVELTPEASTDDEPDQHVTKETSKTPAAEPPAESTPDDTAAAEEPADTTSSAVPEGAANDDEAAQTAADDTAESTEGSTRDSDDHFAEESGESPSTGSTTSGTTRKRSAKNSTRRS